MRKFYLLLCFVITGMLSYAQSVSGSVQTEDGPAIGAIAKLQGSNYGVVTDLNGDFTISNVPAGDYQLEITSVGYDAYTAPISLADGQDLALGSIKLTGGSLALQGVEIIADIAIDRKTPVAVSNIDGEYIAERIGNREITEVIAVTPSVYASQESGGYGDSRITVRGFNDNNVVVMVNGVPVNDMENSALYWSNWTGLQDVANKVQIQRGLGASMLSVPSIGGTVNIISKATDMQRGGWASVDFGNDQFRKYAVKLSTGNMDGWAMTVAGSKTTGNGYVDGNFIDAYSWFGSITKDWDKSSLVLTGFGAPQKHGQGFNRRLNQFVENNGSSSYESFLKSHKAHDFDTRSASLNAAGSANSIRYNDGWGPTNYSVNNGFSKSGIFNQYSNFYHKPQVSLSHFWNASDKFELNTSVYGSWGRGGGASNWGNLNPRNYQTDRGPINWDELVVDNVNYNPDLIGQGSDGEPYYFFRASMNHHNYYGILSKGIINLTDDLTLTVGIDGRTYKSAHVRKIIDLMGLKGYAAHDFVGQPDDNIVIADNSLFGYSEQSLFNRNNTAFVNWMGGYTEFEYAKDKFSASLGTSVSNKSYKKEQKIASSNPEVPGTSDWYGFFGAAVKGGANYNINDAVNIYGNGGFLSIQPIFDNVFQGGNNGGVGDSFIFKDAANEKVMSAELGSGFRYAKFAANLNGYFTNWQDKAITVSGQDNNGENIYGNAFGVDARHMGVELDLRATPVSALDITGAFSFGDWRWQNNTEYTLYDQQGNLVNSGGLYLEDVKVGNAPQSQLNLGGSYETKFGLGLFANYQHNMQYYANFNAEDRDDPTDAGVSPNKLPDFGVANAGISYKLPVTPSNTLRFYFNLNNVFDKLYINSAREGYSVSGGNVTYNDLSSLNGNFGLGRTWSSGVKLLFNERAPRNTSADVPMPAPVMDADGDGVIDSADLCPDTPGTVSGCPDADGDGVIDSEDECETVPGVAANNGCPAEIVIEENIVEVNPDSDGDGLVDEKDNCPDVAGSISNYGCPIPELPAVTQPDNTVVERLNFIARSVFFKTASAELENDSEAQLDAIAEIMREYPNTQFVVEGHTDSVGNADYNKTLSSRRAASVVNYLVKKGISASNLSSVGFGEEQPIASNDTPDGRQQNRRVVIRVR